MKTCSSTSLWFWSQNQTIRRLIQSSIWMQTHSDHSRWCRNPTLCIAPSGLITYGSLKCRNHRTWLPGLTSSFASPRRRGRFRICSRRGASGLVEKIDPQRTLRDQLDDCAGFCVRLDSLQRRFYQLSVSSCATNARTSVTGNSHA